METGQGSQGWGEGEGILFLHKNPNVGLRPPPGGGGGSGSPLPSSGADLPEGLGPDVRDAASAPPSCQMIPESQAGKTGAGVNCCCGPTETEGKLAGSNQGF